MNSDSNTSDSEKSPQKSETRFETKRTLIGLFKQGPLETNRQFAERIVGAFRAHRAKQKAARFEAGAIQAMNSTSLANVPSVKAECLLLAVKGKYYYGESFTKFIPIQEWEYERILKSPFLFYFSTALKKHVDWSEANRKGTTLTFADAVAGTP
jgi:hypothetical protein